MASQTKDRVSGTPWELAGNTPGSSCGAIEQAFCGNIFIRQVARSIEQAADPQKLFGITLGSSHGAIEQAVFGEIFLYSTRRGRSSKWQTYVSSLGIPWELLWCDPASRLPESLHMASDEDDRASGRPTRDLWQYLGELP